MRPSTSQPWDIPFPLLSLGFPCHAQKGLSEVISKVLGSVPPGQSPATLSPDPGRSCDSAVRSSAGVCPQPPPLLAQPAHKGHLVTLSLPAGGRGAGGERPGQPVSAGWGRARGGQAGLLAGWPRAAHQQARPPGRQPHALSGCRERLALGICTEPCLLSSLFYFAVTI